MMMASSMPPAIVTTSPVTMASRAVGVRLFHQFQNESIERSAPSLSLLPSYPFPLPLFSVMWSARVLPGFPAARERVDVGVAHALEVVCGEGGAVAAAAVEY